MSAEVAESSLVTLPFLSRPKALPARYEYEMSNELRAFFASLGVVYQQLNVSGLQYGIRIIETT